MLRFCPHGTTDLKSCMLQLPAGGVQPVPRDHRNIDEPESVGVPIVIGELVCAPPWSSLHYPRDRLRAVVLSLEAGNHRELPAGVREAAEILVAIESTGHARAALDGLGAPRQCALSAGRATGAVATAGCGAFVCHAVLSVCAYIQGCWDRMKLRDVHAVGRSHAGSVTRSSVVWYAVLDALESSHA